MSDLVPERVFIPRPLHPIATLHERVGIPYDQPEVRNARLKASIRTVRAWIDHVFSDQRLHMIEFEASIEHQSPMGTVSIGADPKGFMQEDEPGEWHQIEAGGLNFVRDDGLKRSVVTMGDFYKLDLLEDVRNLYRAAFSVSRPQPTIVEHIKVFFGRPTAAHSATHAELKFLAAAYADSVQISSSQK